MHPPVCFFLLDELRSDLTIEAWIKEVFFELVSHDALLFSEPRLQSSYSFIYFIRMSSIDFGITLAAVILFFRLLHKSLKKILSDFLNVYTLTAVSC